MRYKSLLVEGKYYMRDLLAAPPADHSYRSLTGSRTLHEVSVVQSMQTMMGSATLWRAKQPRSHLHRRTIRVSRWGLAHAIVDGKKCIVRVLDHI